MAIPTSRTNQPAEIVIDTEKCNGCGLCISVCKDFGLTIEDGVVKVGDNPIFGCIGCGHCMTICPTGAIEIHGRTISPDDLYDLPDIKSAANYDQLLALLQRRRSIREFHDKEVPADIIEKILDAARTAPMGLPPSDVNVLLMDTRAKTRAVLDFSQ